MKSTKLVVGLPNPQWQCHWEQGGLAMPRRGVPVHCVCVHVHVYVSVCVLSLQSHRDLRAGGPTAGAPAEFGRVEGSCPFCNFFHGKLKFNDWEWWNGLACIIKLSRVASKSGNRYINCTEISYRQTICCVHVCCLASWPPVYLSILNAH